MKDYYIELMERALSAYSEDHIKRYFETVKIEGLTEHGFPRLTANIGILIAHDRCVGLLPLFLEMMEFCCKTIPTVKAANDFSVREIVSCIRELMSSGAVAPTVIDRWKGYLSAIDPMTCYNVFALLPTDKLKNWALFTGVSEFFRFRMGLGGSEDFIDTQLATQLQWLDENGMYMDGKGDTHHPIMYDLVARGLFAILLSEGYRGRHYRAIDEYLKCAGLVTLNMQSPNGEMAFGGRSNQFVHNEPWMAVVFEYEARRYANEGNIALAYAFKSAIKRALDVTELWLSKDPIYHIKNRFPTDTNFGCEGYAYFDKYMITVASNLYAAYLVCDDTIPTVEIPDHQPAVQATSAHFHKFFLKACGYGLEFDVDADPHYDACGLGRVHREGAPSAICLSIPCPAEPKYTVNLEKPFALSLCPGIARGEEWEFATDSKTEYEVVDFSAGDSSAYATVCTRFTNGIEILAKYTVNAEGVKIEMTGADDIAYLLPAFYFDGESYSKIELADNVLNVSYKGWVCRYTVDGSIQNTEKLAANRNGHYKAYVATAKNSLIITIKILKQ